MNWETPSQAPASRERKRPDRAGPHHRVLVVDDNRDSADSLAMLLRLAAFDVETAYDGDAVLETSRSFHPDIILLDIGLPHVDGYELARRLRDQLGTENATLVAMTGYGMDADRSRSQESGFDAHLVKPVDLNELWFILTGLTHRRRTRDC
jgi:DNA-binding response OmpR family regulator